MQENLDRLRRENVFGKASRSRVEDMLAIFRQRYLDGSRRSQRPWSCWSRTGSPPSLDRILYFHAARADRCCTMSSPNSACRLQAQGITDIDVVEIQQALAKWVAEGKTTAMVGDRRFERVAQGLLSTLRDFGVLQGAVNKRIAPAYCRSTAFAYIACST